MNLSPELKEQALDLIDRALKEDIGDGDITTELVLPEAQFARAEIIAKEDCVLAGLEIVESVFNAIDDTLKIESSFSDGDRLKKGDVLLKIEGNGSAMLKAERTALNFLGLLSGIATLTSRYVDAVSGTETKILDTRKTIPTLRGLEKYAVLAGGGTNHRIGLYDQILIKDNHAAWAGGLDKAVRKILAAVGKDRGLIKVVVEARNKEEVEQAKQRGVDRIMLDNMTPAEVKEIRESLPSAWAIEVSGGINLDTVRKYAETGAEFISVGALTHSAKTTDFTMLFETNK